MAKVDLKTAVVYVENVERIKIVKDTDFDLILKRSDDDYDGPVDYGATGDPVLEIKNGPGGALEEMVTVKSKAVGVSRFFFIQKSETGFIIIKEIRIEVVESIADLAVDLGATGEPIDKELSLNDII